MEKTIYTKISFAIVFIYIMFVLWGQYALIDTVFPLLPYAIGIIVLAYILTKLLFKACRKWMYNFKFSEKPKKKEIKKLAIVTFLVSLAVFMVVFYSRFPGILFIDSVMQIDQCVTNSYIDWHPVLDTLLVFWLPVKLNAIWLAELLQIIFFCLALTYMVCTLRFYGCPKTLCIISLVYILMQPDTTYIMLFPCKDGSFSILSLLLITELIHIVLTRGTWLKKNINLIFFIITLVVGTIVRHNAILFTLPLLVAAVFWARKELKRCIICVLCVILLFVAIKVPLYNSLNATKPGYRVTETMGMCIVMMANAYIENDYLMSDEAVEFLSSIQESKNLWDLYYTSGDWNYVKALEDTNWNAIEETGRKNVFKYTIDTLISAPDQTLKAFLDVTGMVWKVDGTVPWMTYMNVYDSNFDLILDNLAPGTSEVVSGYYDSSTYTSATVNEYVQTYRKIIRESFLNHIFCYIGLLNMILIVLCFAGIEKKGDLRRILYILPLICNNFGTALLLSGYDNRFFYYTFLCFFPILILLLKDKKTDVVQEVSGAMQDEEKMDNTTSMEIMSEE